MSIKERTSGLSYTIKLKTPVRDINIDVCFQQGNELNDGKKGCKGVLITHNIIAVMLNNYFGKNETHNTNTTTTTTTTVSDTQ